MMKTMSIYGARKRGKRERRAKREGKAVPDITVNNFIRVLRSTLRTTFTTIRTI